MKRICLLLMAIGLLMIVSCQSDQTDEQAQVGTADSIEQPIPTVTESAVTELPTETIASVEPLITPTHDNDGLSTEADLPILSLLTESDQPIEQYILTEYEFVNASVDDWADSNMDTGQPWLALARVIQKPYRIGEFDPYAPLWVLLGPEDVVGEVVAWQESVGDEIIGTASLFRTVPLPADITLSDLLLARNEWYLPELEGVLWVDRMLFKTDAENWSMNVVSPEVRPVLTNIPYSFSCDTTMLRCIRTNHFDTEANANKEYSIQVDSFPSDTMFSDAGFDYTLEILYLDDGRALLCNPELQECRSIVSPSIICDLDKGDCTYQPSIDKQPQVYKLVSNDVNWLLEERTDRIFSEHVNTLTNQVPLPPSFISNVTCNLDREECYYQETPFDCQFNNEEKICFLQPVTQWPERIEAQIVPLSHAEQWLESESHLFGFKCNWQLKECVQEYPQFAECDPVTFTCLLPDKGMEFDEEAICDSEEECWDRNSFYQLIECNATGEKTALCEFGHKYSSARYEFTVIFSRSQGVLEGYTSNSDYSLECSFEEKTCYTIDAYEVDCHALTEQCTVLNTYTNESMIFDFITEIGDVFEKPDNMGVTIMNYDFYLPLQGTQQSPSIYCDMSTKVCQVYPNNFSLGGGDTWETRRCDLLSCPDGYLCSVARYNQYQCYLYNTLRPQR